MKYRKIIELSDRKIRKIVNDIVAPVRIKSINRNLEDSAVEVMVETDWETYDDEDNLVTYTDEEMITLTDPWSDEGITTDGHYSFSNDEIFRYHQFCMANGVCKLYLENNPYRSRRDSTPEEYKSE